MPSLEVDSYGVEAVATFTALLDDLLSRAEVIKPTGTIEPALNRSDFDDLPSRLSQIFADYLQADAADGAEGQKKIRQFAIIETAVREVFGGLIATTSIDSPDFVKVWNLFDILSTLADMEECNPALLFWLIEELLDSQTIAGCRKVFDFLESRRERITSKHSSSIKLVILRSCNDLLRRLSRAEDTPFCGRVFIFLFQVFPLGDKSSVNARGEYHVENVTTYDETPAGDDGPGEKMEIDAGASAGAGTKSSTKADGSESKDGKPLKPEALYPVFWSLQTSFSQPKRLFDPAHFAHFKFGLEATLAAFKQIQSGQGSRLAKQVDETKRGVKRKREEKDDELADTYNPKYLTSRDLFELETSDLTFRRHFLVQALIIMEFLLSLSAKGKERLATVVGAPNKSVTYSDQLLSEDDTNWVTKMKHDITEHIRGSNSDGAYFLRMVDTILARDKNWVRWKVELCPSIEIPAVSPEEFASAKEAAHKAFSNKRIRPVPMGSFSLGFLEAVDGEAALEKYKSRDRYALPELESFKNQIAVEDLEIEMPRDDKSKAEAEERKASKTWRALRVASRLKLAAFDKIENDDKIDIIFSEEEIVRGPNPENLPSDTRPVIICGPQGAGKSSLSRLLMERNPEVFGEVMRHTTKAPQSAGHYHFVDSKTFNVMLDQDRFLEFSDVDGVMYGTSQGLVDTVSESGKVPFIQMNLDSVQQAKDAEYSARYIFIEPPSIEVLESRLKDAGIPDDEVQGILMGAVKEIEQAKSGRLFDKIIVNDDLEAACGGLEAFIYGLEEEGEGTNTANGQTDTKQSDVVMADDGPGETTHVNGAETASSAQQ